jgi:hypothetical protein
LYAKGKQPIFLQKFHHVGAVICWHLGWMHSLDETMTTTILNSFIHSIMYAYYLGTILKVNLKFVKPYITYLQMLQFVVGLYASYSYFFLETPVQRLINILGSIYTIGNFVLFGKFIQDNYTGRIKEI